MREEVSCLVIKRGRVDGGFNKLITGDNLEMSTKRAIKRHFRRDYI